MKEEFPRDHHVTARVSGKTKRKLKKIPYTVGDVLEIGADYLCKEINLLEFQKGELELDLAELRKETASKEAELHEINNRIRIINPRRLDKETLNNLISEAALDYASEIYEAHGKSSLEKIEAKVSKQTIFNVAAEWGYDKLKFMELVKNHLKILCNT